MSPFIFFIYPFDWAPRDTDRYGFAVLKANGFIPLAMTPTEYAACALTPRMIVMLVHYCLATWWVYRLVTVRKHPYVLENLNALPGTGEWTWRHYLGACGHPLRVINRVVFRRIPTWLVGVRPPDLVLCGGSASKWKGVML